MNAYQYQKLWAWLEFTHLRIYEFWIFIAALWYKRLYTICHYKPSVKIMDLVCHITYIACVNFLHKWQNIPFQVVSKWQIFEELFIATLYSLRIFAKICWEEVAEEINFFFSYFRFDLKPRFTSNKLTHYLLNHGDFKAPYGKF